MSSADTADHDALIKELSNLTSIPPQEAHRYLEANQWDLSGAATEYYTSLEDLTNQEEAADADVHSQNTRLVPSDTRPLDGNPPPQPIPTTSNMPPAPASSANQPPKKKFATLGDLSGSGPSSHAGHGHEEDGDDSDDENQDLFAGGEKSGLAVQNPDDLKRKIIERAQRLGGLRYPPRSIRYADNCAIRDAARPGGDEPRAPSSRFTGTARTLGGDDAPSRVIQDSAASAPRRPALVERRLHFWQDGFSVDDGPLYRTDDPANAEILAMIRQGRAPLHIMNVEHTQEVDVKLEQHEEKYVQPKKQYKPFSGGGQRLGSPTPGDSLNSTITAPMASAGSTFPQTEPAAPVVDVNDSRPTLSLQIRLGDGTRLVSRFNTTHTVGDVYGFINSSSPSSRERPWVLMTTFPSKELQDKAQALGDLSELKRGGVVVQKWQ
ncbi:MAG: hypothetical protein Q9195_004287 [Heterodermia aff. obscurata]